MDGGLINNMPVDLARARGCDIIIAIDVSTPGNLPAMPESTHQSGWWILLQKLTGGHVSAKEKRGSFLGELTFFIGVLERDGDASLFDSNG